MSIVNELTNQVQTNKYRNVVVLKCQCRIHKQCFLLWILNNLLIKFLYIINVVLIEVDINRGMTLSVYFLLLLKFLSGKKQATFS